MSEHKERYNSVVHDSLIEKGFKPVPETIWTYYLRDLFKPVFGLTWFHGQWWCPDEAAYSRLEALCTEIDQLFAEHLTKEELHQLRAKLKAKSTWMAKMEK